MAAAEHRIGRVVFEIAAPDRAAVTHFGEVVRARFESSVVPALQAALDRIDRPEALLRFDRVEVALGTLDGVDPVGDELARRITEGLVAALDAAPPPGPAAASPAGDDVAELCAFLESGELRWTEPGRALAVLVAALLALDAAGMTRLAARLRTVLLRRRAGERLVRQLPAALVRRIFRALLPEPLQAPLAAAFGPDQAGDGTAVDFVPESLIRPLSEELHRLARDAERVDLGAALTLFAMLDGRTQPLSAPAVQPPVAAPPTSALDVVSGTPATPLGAVRADVAEDLAEKEGAETWSRPVHAAGAVLLHPFLGAWFERLGLLAGPGAFRDRGAQARAVLLAHHLATGAEEAPEPETTLFKLLCGMPFANPIPRRIAPTEVERAETDELLASVIAHWQRLGKTSAAGVREGFLTRPGRLQREGLHWRLSVEPRGIDVLLDGLPWTLSRVKTPFMRSLLTVDWR